MHEQTIQQIRFWLFLLATFLGAVDLSLSKEKRTDIKSTLEDWWLKLQYSRTAVLLAAGASRLESLYRKIFGQRIMSVRFIVTAALWGIATTGITAVYLFRDTEHARGNVAAAFANAALPNAIVTFLSLGTTVLFLRRLSHSASLKQMIMLTMADILVAFALSVALVRLTFYMETVTHRSVTLTANDALILALPLPISAPFQALIVLYSIAWVGFIAVLPHVVVTNVLLFSKWSRPIWQPITGWILLRLESSPRGAIAALGAGVVVLAELLGSFGDAYLY